MKGSSIRGKYNLLYGNNNYILKEIAMWTYENKLVKTQRDVEPYLRIIVSYKKVCFQHHKRFDVLEFKDFLRLHKDRLGIDEYDIYNMVEIADCGKMEIEYLADRYFQQSIITDR